MSEPIPWLPISASVLAVIALILFRSLGKAVGVTLVYLGAGLEIRVSTGTAPEVLKVIAPQVGAASGKGEVPKLRRSMAMASSFTRCGDLLIGVGATFFVLASAK